jgi:hypothetical protein
MANHRDYSTFVIIWLNERNEYSEEMAAVADKPQDSIVCGREHNGRHEKDRITSTEVTPIAQANSAMHCNFCKNLRIPEIFLKECSMALISTLASLDGGRTYSISRHAQSATSLQIM